MSDAGLADSTETLLPRCGVRVPSPFSMPGEAPHGDPKSRGPEALFPTDGMEMLEEAGGCPEATADWGGRRWGPLPWVPEKMRLSLLLRVSLGTSLERRRPPVCGEPKVGVVVGLEPCWGPS